MVPRARNIKPGFFMNEDLAECDLAARLLFIGLWCLADREGRLEDRPKKIKAFVFPYENFNVDELLNQLQEHNFILRYQVNGSKYIQVINFTKHQNPHPKETASVIPAPNEHLTESHGNYKTSREKVVTSNGNSETSHADLLNPDLLNPDILIPDSLNPDLCISDPLTPSSANVNVGSCVCEPPEPRENSPKNRILSNVQLERFNQFWFEYPKKKAKLAAMRVWVRLKPDEELFDDIMMGLRRARASMEWKREGGRFIPHPATFLNQGRWEDEYMPSEQQPTKRDLQNMSVEEYVATITRSVVPDFWEVHDGGVTHEN